MSHTHLTVGCQGDAVKNPLLMIPGVADLENLQPVYEVASAAIRTVTPAIPIFFESVSLVESIT